MTQSVRCEQHRFLTEVTNLSGKAQRLVDVDLEDFSTDGETSGGGEGQPVFIDDEMFAA